MKFLIEIVNVSFRKSERKPRSKDVFKPIGLDETRIALVQFGAQVHNEHLFADLQTYEAVNEKLSQIQHLKGIFRSNLAYICLAQGGL